MYKAGAKMATGMGVVKNRISKTVDIPADGTVAGFYFVTKERVPKGINSALEEMSDYHDDFNQIELNEMVKLIIPEVGERYATDQYVATGLTQGDGLMIKGGKFVKATGESKLVYDGIYDDAGHKLAIVEITA